MAVLAALCLLLLAGPRCLGQYPAGPDEAEEAPTETGPPDKMHIGTQHAASARAYI